MVNKTKITEEIALKIKEMAEKGMNPTAMGKILNLSKDTVKNFCNKNGISVGVRVRTNVLEKEKLFCELLSTAKHLKELQKSVGIGNKQANEWASKYGRDNLRRNRKEASKDKMITKERIKEILPYDEMIGRNQISGKIILRAANGTIYEKNISHIKQGNPEGKFGHIQTISMIKSRLIALGYSYIEGTYSETHKSLQAIHLECGNTRENRIRNFEEQRCATCSNNGVSLPETEVSDWVKSLGFDSNNVIKYKFAERITRPQEIDVFVSSLNIGIEYCGLEWHNEQRKEVKYHINKMENANKEGIRLITIFEDEWLERKDAVKTFLRSALGKNINNVYARKCTVDIIAKSESSLFLDKYHIQKNSPTSCLNVGIKENGILLGVMSFSRHHRQNVREDSVSLSRLAFKENFNVAGGTGKMLKLAIAEVKKMGFNHISTMSDSRWSEGKVYESLGFVNTNTSKPDYSYYVGGSKRVSKQSCKKELMAKKGAIGNTEQEMANSLGYKKIWDCGKKRWEMDI